MPLPYLCFPEPSCQGRRCKRCRFNPWVGKIPWRKEWQPTPVFLPGESHGWRSLEGYSPRGHQESDTTEYACMPFLRLPAPNSRWLLSLLCPKLRDAVTAWRPGTPHPLWNPGFVCCVLSAWERSLPVIHQRNSLFLKTQLSSQLVLPASLYLQLTHNACSIVSHDIPYMC